MMEIEKYGDLSPRDLEMAGSKVKDEDNKPRKRPENHTYADTTPEKELNKTIRAFSRENMDVVAKLKRINRTSRHDHYRDERDIMHDKQHFNQYYDYYNLIDRLDSQASIYMKEKKLERKLTKQEAAAPGEARFIQEKYNSMLERLGLFLETIMAMSSLEFETHLEVIDETYQSFVGLRHELDICMGRY